MENILPICHTHTGAGAAMNTSFSRCATHPGSYELPVCPAHLVARLWAGKTRQTHCGPLCLSLSQVWVSRPSRRHGRHWSNRGIQVCVAPPRGSLTRVCLRHRLFEYLPSQLSGKSWCLGGRGARGLMTVHFGFSQQLGVKGQMINPCFAFCIDKCFHGLRGFFC